VAEAEYSRCEGLGTNLELEREIEEEEDDEHDVAAWRYYLGWRKGQ
jgi:hypothetical protein